MIKAINVIHGDITEFEGDAIVNPANVGLKGGGGLCGQIFEVAGDEELSKACAEIGYCAFGDAVVTPGFQLSAKYIIHTATPIYGQHDGAEDEILRSCYWESLRRAEGLELTTIAFPLLSAGIHRYPKHDAAEIANQAIEEYLEDNSQSKISVSLYAYSKEDSLILNKI